MINLNEIIDFIKKNIWDNQKNRSGFMASSVLVVIIIFLVLNYFEKTKEYNLFPQENQTKQAQENNIETETDAEKGEILSQTDQKDNLSTYQVVFGDSLWFIAENKLHDPFRWPELVDLNNLQKNTDGLYILYPGQVLKLPIPDNSTPQTTAVLAETGIGDQSTIYTVQKGDNLWNIAEKIYGDGALWHLIDDTNVLGRLNGNPLIHSGNQLLCPDFQSISSP